MLGLAPWGNDEAADSRYSITPQEREILEFALQPVNQKVHEQEWLQALIQSYEAVESIRSSKLRSALLRQLEPLLYCFNPKYLKTLSAQLPPPWADFARLHANSSEISVDAVNLWIQRHPNHPASGFFQQLLRSKSLIGSAPSPRRIALALPLTGEYAQASEPLLQGLLSQYYASSSDTELYLLDSSSLSADALLQRAAQNKAELFIGPLNKTLVQQTLQLYATRSYPFRLLLLNQPDRALPPRAFAYALSPQYESLQLAARLQHSETQNPLILLGKDTWAQQQLRRLTTYWTQAKTYPDLANDRQLTELIASALGTTASSKRHRQIARLTNTPLEFEPRRRQDIDALVLLLSTDIARRVIPALDYNFASRLLVIAPSQVWRHSEKESEPDLYGLPILALPLQSRTPLPSQWQLPPITQSNQQNAFTAIGIDIWHLAQHLASGRTLRGASGLLRITPKRLVIPQNVWARYSAAGLRADEKIWHYPLLDEHWAADGAEGVSPSQARRATKVVRKLSPSPRRN